MNIKFKSILNPIWKVGLGLLGLFVIGLAILLASIWHEKSYGRAYWKDKTLSKDIEVIGFNNNCVRVWDWQSRKYVTPKLRWVSGTPQRDSITDCNKVSGLVTAASSMKLGKYLSSSSRAFS